MAIDGSENHVGESDDLFSVQSISKAVLYGLALETLGREEVHLRVGVEPSGERFNAIDFDEVTNRAFNPMVNAGALDHRRHGAGRHARTTGWTRCSTPSGATSAGTWRSTRPSSAPSWPAPTATGPSPTCC